MTKQLMINSILDQVPPKQDTAEEDFALLSTVYRKLDAVQKETPYLTVASRCRQKKRALLEMWMRDSGRVRQ